MTVEKGKFTENHQLKLDEPFQVSAEARQPPQISRIVLAAQAGQDPKFQTSVEKGAAITFTAPAGASPPPDPKQLYKDGMGLVFKHLFERLKLGIDEGWATVYGYAGDPDPSTEEQWARTFSEMVVYCGYAGTSGVHGTKGKNEGMSDMEYLGRLGAGQDDPAYPIMMACQHLSTLLVLSRGCDPDLLYSVRKNKKGEEERVMGGMTAGAGTGALQIFQPAKNPGSKWIETGKTVMSDGSAVPDNATSEQEEKKQNVENGAGRDLGVLIKDTTNPLTPGSVFAFNDRGPRAQSQHTAHIASVLRVCLNPVGIQGIDTGPIAASGGHDTGTADHELRTGIGDVMSGKLVGVGILPKKDVEQSTVDFVRTARPLGFAQLIVADANKIIRYVGPLLHMHHGDLNFAVTRYVWSVRCFPAEGVQVFWLITVPKVGGVSRALNRPGSRNKPLADLLPSEFKSQALGAYLEPVNVIGSTTAKRDSSGAAWKDSGPIGWRRKIDGKTKNKWISMLGAKEVDIVGNDIFAQDLKELIFADQRQTKLYNYWSNKMKFDSEYTCADPQAAKNEPLADVSKSADYFGGPWKPETLWAPIVEVPPSAPASPGS